MRRSLPAVSKFPGFGFRLRNVPGFEQIFQFGHKLLYVLEVEVHGGESYVGDFVVPAEAVHDQFADFAGLALSFGGFDHEGFCLVHDLLEFTDRYRTLFTGAHQSIEDFLAVKTLAASVFLDHHVGDFFDALVGGEALLALEAFAAAADGVGLFTLARIHNFVVFKPAKGAFHALGCALEVKMIVAGDAGRIGSQCFR